MFIGGTVAEWISYRSFSTAVPGSIPVLVGIHDQITESAF